MKAKSARLLLVVSLFLLPLVVTGCGGLHARGSVSPLDFLLPGAGQLLRVEDQTPSAPASLETNTLLASYVTCYSRKEMPGRY